MSKYTTKNLYFLYTGISCKDIYVANNGVLKDCGAFDKPCGDLAYTINTMTEDGDTVYLLPDKLPMEDTEQLAEKRGQIPKTVSVFAIKEPIQIHPGFLYIKGAGTKDNEIILTSSDIFNGALFQRKTDGILIPSSSIYLENIHFKDVTLFESNTDDENSLTIDIRNCLLTGTATILTSSTLTAFNETLKNETLEEIPSKVNNIQSSHIITSVNTSSVHNSTKTITPTYSTITTTTTTTTATTTATTTTTTIRTILRKVKIINSIIDTSECIVLSNIYNHSVSLSIQNSKIASGCISSTNSYIDLEISNLTWNASMSTRNNDFASSKFENLINIKGKYAKKSYLTLKGVKIVGNYSNMTFLRCENCQIRGNDITLRDTTLKSAFTLDESDVDFGKIVVSGSAGWIAEHLLHLSSHNKAHFKEIKVTGSNFGESFVVVNGTSKATFEKLIVKNGHFSRQLLTTTNGSFTEIYHIHVKSSVIKHEMLRVREIAALLVHHIEAYDSKFHQAVLCFSEPEGVLPSGSLRMLRSIFKNNTVPSTFFGVVDSPEFLLKDMIFVNNNAGDLFHSSDVENVTLSDLVIDGNEFKSGFIIQTSTIFMNRIEFSNNVAKGHGKALIYESSCDHKPHVRLSLIFLNIISLTMIVESGA